MHGCRPVDLPGIDALALKRPRILNGRARVFFDKSLQLGAVGLGIGADVSVKSSERLSLACDGLLNVRVILIGGHCQKAKQEPVDDAKILQEVSQDLV